MSADVNFVCLTGRLAKDIEIKDLPNSHLVTGTLMVFRSVKKDSGYEDVCSFIDIKTFIKSDKQVEFYKSAFVKNAKVVVNGSIEQDRWEKDGEKKSRITINVSNITPFGSNGNSKPAANNTPADNDFPEDLPF